MKTEQLYQQRLNRYVTAMRNEKPDRIPIRPFVAEFTGTYAGCTCQEVAKKLQELPAVTANPELVRQVWEDVDAFGVTYIWQMLESF